MSKLPELSVMHVVENLKHFYQDTTGQAALVFENANTNITEKFVFTEAELNSIFPNLGVAVFTILENPLKEPSLMDFHGFPVLARKQALLASLTLWQQDSKYFLFSDNGKSVEYWENIQVQEDLHVVSIYSRKYKIAVRNEVPIVLRQPGTTFTLLSKADADTIYPGLVEAYLVAKQLGLDEAATSRHCRDHVFCRQDRVAALLPQDITC